MCGRRARPHDTAYAAPPAVCYLACISAHVTQQTYAGFDANGHSCYRMHGIELISPALPSLQGFKLEQGERRTMGSKLTDLWLQVGQTSVLLYSPWKWSTITESLLAR